MDNYLYQCPTCGRMASDWSKSETKAISKHLTKIRQRPDAEDRTLRYRQWRWKFGDGCYVCDIDQLEWRIIDGKITPVALLEISRVDGNVAVPDSYLDAVLKRFITRDGQGDAIMMIAKLLNIKVWIVLFRWDLTEFWVYNLSDKRGWFKSLSPEKYEKWIKMLDRTP